MRNLSLALVAVLLFGAPWIALNYPEKISSITDAFMRTADQLAAVITHNPRTIADLQEKYHPPTKRSPAKVRVLIVPGHEPDFGGAEFKNITERDFVVEIANDIAGFLRANPHYEVFVTRDTERWSPEFEPYFKDHWQDIIDWQSAYKEENTHLISVGSVKKSSPLIYHNAAPHDVALRLYGITKWANDNDIDIVLHVHLNDHPGHSANREGTYSGLAIYIPEDNYANSPTTRVVAENIFNRLQKYSAVSDLPGESRGLVEEPDLIAIGANNTADAASMLIEYGYLYEPQFQDPDVRGLAFKDLAFQTYLGLQDFFDETGAVNIARSYDTLMLPYLWKESISDADGTTRDIFALQTALLVDGEYPPNNKSKNDCPRTGTFGPCTRTAVKAFQNKYEIEGGEGNVGPKTVEVLNAKYGLGAID